MLERKPSETDKRVMIVHLTEKGKQIQQPETDYQNIFDCLLPEELQQLSQYLDCIIEAFQAQIGDTSEGNNRIDWMSQARERMGNERFEQLMSMRERAFGHMRPPKDIPGAEHFSENYTGPVPDRRGFPSRNFRPDNR